MDQVLNIENREYRFKKLNASKCWVAIKDVLKMVGKMDLLQATNGEGATQALGVNILKGVLENLGAPEMKKVEDLILSHTFFIEGEYFLNERFDEHFNQYPQDLVTVLLEGAKFQFLPFFKGGAKLLGNMNG